MQLTGLMVALIAIALITTSGVALYGNVMVNYGAMDSAESEAVSSAMSSAFDQSNNVIALSEQIGGNQTGILGAIKTIPILGSFGSVVIAGVQILTLMFRVPSYYVSMVDLTFQWLGLPPYVGTLIIAAITIVLTITIVSSIVNWRTN